MCVQDCTCFLTNNASYAICRNFYNQSSQKKQTYETLKENSVRLPCTWSSFYIKLSKALPYINSGSYVELASRPPLKSVRSPSNTQSYWMYEISWVTSNGIPSKSNFVKISALALNMKSHIHGWRGKLLSLSSCSWKAQKRLLVTLNRSLWGAALTSHRSCSSAN
jgi:hypothetical protein